MKKIMAVLMSLVLLMTGMPITAETASTIDVIFDRVQLVVNGIETDTSTLLYDGRTYIQLAGAAQAFNATLDWDGETNTVYLNTSSEAAEAVAGAQANESSQSISVIFDRVKIYVNGENTDITTLLYDGRTYIQLAGASQAFEAELDWDGETNTVYLSTVSQGGTEPQALPEQTTASSPSTAPSTQAPAVTSSPSTSTQSAETEATSEPTTSVVYVTETGTKYHRAGCSYLKKSSIQMSKQDAISKGYTACSKCNP